MNFVTAELTKRDQMFALRAGLHALEYPKRQLARLEARMLTIKLDTIKILLTVESTEVDTANARQLSKEQKAQFLSTLETRISDKPHHFQRPANTSFDDVKNALEAREDLLWSLYKMDQSGGVPDLIDNKDGVFVFADCAQEAPHRNTNYVEAAASALEFGVAIMSEEEYRSMQKIGYFDSATKSWIQATVDMHASLCAPYATRSQSDIYVYQSDPFFKDPHWGWRGVLRVPKV